MTIGFELQVVDIYVVSERQHNQILGDRVLSSLKPSYSAFEHCELMMT
jgi:hypothetical protein